MKPIISILLNLALFSSLFAQQGLKAEYYNGTDFNQKVATRTEGNIDKSWNDIPPVPGLDPHNCSIRWTGKLTAPASGTYTFSAKVDDGIRVWVGGVKVIDDWKLNDNGQFAGQVVLREGTPYDLKVEYFNALVEGEVRLLWALPNTQTPVVVDSKFFSEKPKPAASQAPAKVEVKKDKPISNSPKPTPKVNPPPTKPEPNQQPAADGGAVALHRDTLERYLPKNVLFEQGKSIMLDKSKPGLDHLASFLLRNPKLNLTIEGHTDIIGDMDMNNTLSGERAKVVAEYLASKGIEQTRLEAKGYGSSRPLVTGNSKKGYPENRRVAFIVH